MKRVVCGLLLVTLFAGCGRAVRIGNSGDQVVGSGTRKTERREVANFDRLTVDGAYVVEVACGPGPSLEIEADDNLLPLIKADVEGGRLHLRGERGMSTRALPRVRLTVPDLKEIDVPGAGEFSLTGVKNEGLKINVPGAGKFRAEGETGRLEIKLSGAGRIDAAALRARHVSAECNGAGSISVHATDVLDAAVNGVGSIDYSGDPPEVNQHVGGLGTISKR